MRTTIAAQNEIPPPPDLNHRVVQARRKSPMSAQERISEFFSAGRSLPDDETRRNLRRSLELIVAGTGGLTTTPGALMEALLRHGVSPVPGHSDPLQRQGLRRCAAIIAELDAEIAELRAKAASY